MPLAERRMFLCLRSSTTTSPLARAIWPATWCSQMSWIFVLFLRPALTCFLQPLPLAAAAFQPVLTADQLSKPVRSVGQYFPWNVVTASVGIGEDVVHSGVEADLAGPGVLLAGVLFADDQVDLL